MSFRSSTSCFCFKIKRAQVLMVCGREQAMGEHLRLADRAGTRATGRNQNGSAYVVHVYRRSNYKYKQTGQLKWAVLKQPCKKGSQPASFCLVFPRADRSTSKREEEKPTKALKESRHSFDGRKENLQERADAHTTQALLEHVATSWELTDSHFSHEIWIHPFVCGHG